MTTERERYLARKGVVGPWQIEGAADNQYTAAVVIPACDEEKWLFCTLASLAKNPPEYLQQTLILIVLNHSDQAPDVVRATNRRTLERLRNDHAGSSMQLAWIDAVSDGLEFTAGGAGVARRLGLDRALQHLAKTGDPLLICLDADTVVEPNYLQTLQQHFAQSQAGGGVIPFEHQKAETPQLQMAIDRYELFLRSYLLGLQLAGSSYAYHTVGSAMACRASAYVRAGGMSQRPAGEDFYFLQNLAKTGGVETVCGTCVYPSARISNRVPFGTGPTLGRLQIEPESLLFYPLEAFLVLGDFLQLVTGWMATGEALQEQVDRLNPPLGHFMQEQKLAAVIDRLRQNSSGQEQFCRAFHVWFDGLKSLRLLRRLCSGSPFSMASAEESVPALLMQAGLEGAADLPRMLELLRIQQNSR